jgi:ATPase subunit of ABC transporter with duplicated ATPase domains
VKVGYYRQDFSGLPMDKTVYEVLAAAMDPAIQQEIYSTAARFMLTGEKVQTKVEALSEGQKGNKKSSEEKVILTSIKKSPHRGFFDF